MGREEIRAPLKTPAWEAIPERTLVKNSYKRSRASLPSPPLLFIAFFTSHRSPLSERLEQAKTNRQMLAKDKNLYIVDGKMFFPVLST